MEFLALANSFLVILLYLFRSLGSLPFKRRLGGGCLLGSLWPRMEEKGTSIHRVRWSESTTVP